MHHQSRAAAGRGASSSGVASPGCISVKPNQGPPPPKPTTTTTTTAVAIVAEVSGHEVSDLLDGGEALEYLLTATLRARAAIAPP
jgi:hypothetical protein